LKSSANSVDVSKTCTKKVALAMSLFDTFVYSLKAVWVKITDELILR